MDERLHVETVYGSLARSPRILGLTLSEWLAVGLVSGQIMLYAERLHRKIFFLSFSHFLFLATALALYLGILFFHARRPPRYLVHRLQFWARTRYLIAHGIHESKTGYWTS